MFALSDVLFKSDLAESLQNNFAAPWTRNGTKHENSDHLHSGNLIR